MNLSTLGQQLHDRATRGETLSIAEQAQLDLWYDAINRAEMEQLLKTEPDTQALRSQIMSLLKRVSHVAKQIEQIATENEKIRHENAALRRQLALKGQPS